MSREHCNKQREFLRIHVCVYTITFRVFDDVVVYDASETDKKTKINIGEFYIEFTTVEIID